MINRIITFSVRNKFIVGLFVIGLIGWGIFSLSRLPIDAIPDITNNQVQVISIAPSLAVQEVESFITAPIEVAVANIPDIIELRSISRLGLSVVTVVFKDKVDVYWARQQLNERLREAEESIPPGLAQISLAPVSSGLGEIFQYRLSVGKGFEKKYTPMELRTLQDWVVRREMLGTPGVADINSYGGFVKEYEIAVNPERMRAMKLTLNDIFTALENNNENTGSAYIDKNPNAWFIRGIGLVKSLDDISRIMIREGDNGIPVLIRDVATVQYGNATRYGAFVVDTAEAVGGVVMMLKGANAHEVIDNVAERIQSIQKSLPKEVKIEPYLNRSDLVGRAIKTVSRNLIEGALIVIFILVLLLGNIRAGLIVASVIPLSMLFAVSMMRIFGVSGNLMSLGAIDFGLIVDGAVIIVESAVHRIFTRRKEFGSTTRLTQGQMDENVLASAKRMMNSATFGQIIILIVYLPIMALVGIEGKMFRPMAQVVTFALIGAAILSLTYVPMASALFLSKRASHRHNLSDWLMEGLHRVFNPVIGFALRNKLLVSLGAIILFVFSLFVFNRLGGEFIPQLEEGDLASGVMTLQGGSLTHTVDQVIKANKILLDNFPEIRHAVCKIGAGEIPTDPTPMETGDYIITLKDKSEWVSAKTREELVEKMEDKLVTLAGVKFEFQQPIAMRFNELMTGSKQDIAIKIFGDNLTTLAERADEVEKIIQTVPGVEDINVEKVTGLSQIQVEYNRDRLAEYGLSVADANRELRAAFAGIQAGVVYDEEKRFGLVVRLDKDYRTNVDDVRNLTVVTSSGIAVPFGQIADVAIKSGPAQVSREDTKRRITVGFNVRNRDIKSVISEVSARIDRQLTLPTGYFITFGGQFRNLEAAQKRLSIAVPIALLLIFILLYFTFHSARQSLLIFSAVPLSAIGGIFALWIRGMNFSISAGVGFIALFGVAVLNGIVLISEFNRLEKKGLGLHERVLKGLHTRLRPVVMTAAVASLGFLPMALSTSAGAEVQKPLATVVIGGLITATLLTLIILPVFYMIFSPGYFRQRSGKGKGPKTLPLVLLLFVLPLAHPARAQEARRIGLEEAVKMALDSNLTVRSATYEMDRQRALKGAAVDLPKTSIEAEYGQFNSITKDNAFTVSQTLAFPSVYAHRSKLAREQVNTARWQLESTRLDIATRVKQLYWQGVYLDARRKLLLEQDSLYSSFARAADLKAKAGEAVRLEMMTARSQSLEIKNQLFQVETDISVCQRQLMTLLNTSEPVWPADTDLRYRGPGVVPDTAGPGHNPGLGRVREQINLSLTQRKLESSLSLPELTIGYFSQTIIGDQEVDGAVRSFGSDYRFTGVQAGIAVPIWYRPWASRTKAARINEIKARNDAEDLSKSLSGTYLSLLDEYRKYLSTVRYYEEQAVPEANLIIRQADTSYRSGALDFLDYVQSLDRAMNIRRNYLDALNSFRQTLISIENITGKIE